jgi:hypothetical protein
MGSAVSTGLDLFGLFFNDLTCLRQFPAENPKKI